MVDQSMLITEKEKEKNSLLHFLTTAISYICQFKINCDNKLKGFFFCASVVIVYSAE